MAANVVVCAQALGGPHDDDREPADLVDVEVTDVGNLLLSTRHLPDPGPEMRHLQLVIAAIDVASDGYGYLIAGVAIHFRQWPARRDCVACDEALVGDA